MGTKTMNAPASAATLAEIESARTELEAAQAKVARLEFERAEVLLNGTDEEAAAHDTILAAARRQVDRMNLLIPRLKARREEELEAEASSRDAERIRQAEDSRSEAEALVSRYETLAREIAGVLEDLQEVNVEIAHVRSVVREERRRDAPAELGANLYDPTLPRASAFSFGGGGQNGGVRLPAASGTRMIFGTNLDTTEAQAREWGQRERERRLQAWERQNPPPVNTWMLFTVIDGERVPQSPAERPEYALYRAAERDWQQRRDAFEASLP
jgi:K+/H+ antiporter YhaU regulatory subunit KhtT